MKYAHALVALASIVLVGCGTNSPTGPSSISPSKPMLASSSPAPAVTARGFFPPISPPGISCPSDAPQIRVGSLNGRMDIDFSEVTGAYSYEIQIRRYNGANRYDIVDEMKVPAPANHADWYGEMGKYMVKVRTINCGGLGNWSESIYHALDENGVRPPPPPEPESEPEDPEHPHCLVGCFPED